MSTPRIPVRLLLLVFASLALHCHKDEALAPDPPFPEPDLPRDAVNPVDVPAPAPEEMCSLVGCFSGISFFVHLNESPAAIGRRGAFHVCHRDECWDGTFGAFGPPPPEPAEARWPCVIPRAITACELLPEGRGSRLSFMIVGGRKDLVDGDLVTLSASVGGRRVAQYSRYVTYALDFPNGVRCGGACRVAAAELWPGARNGATCPNQICNPVVRFETTAPITRDGAGLTMMTACRNEDCKSEQVPILWRWDDAKNEAIPVSSGGVGFASVGGASVSVKLATGLPTHGHCKVTIEFRGDPRTYRSGDVYRVQWKSLEGELLMSEERVVGAYDESYPGGRECSPVACKTKIFSE